MEKIMALYFDAESTEEGLVEVGDEMSARWRAGEKKKVASYQRRADALMRREGVTTEDLDRYIAWRHPVGEMEEER
jgi:hypothetical protein